ncbi:MAG: hypothetical protein ACYDHU_11510 [Acidimicrobiales bacterium]
MPGLRLEFGAAGLSLTKFDGSPVWAARWDQVDELATPERSRLPDQGDGVVLVVGTNDRCSHRFVLPSDEPAALEAVLETIARNHGAHRTGARRAQPLVIVVSAIVIVAAVAIVLVLAAGHVIHL